MIIYSHSNEFSYLRELITGDETFVSEFLKVEVPGYHLLKTQEEKYFQDIVNFVTVIFPTAEIFDKSIQIRRKFNLTLGDSLIAVTAIVNNLSFYTRNLPISKK